MCEIGIIFLMSVLSQLSQLIRPYKKQYVFSILGLLISSVDTFIPMLISRSIDAATFGYKSGLPVSDPLHIPPGDPNFISTIDANRVIQFALIWTIGVILFKVFFFFISRYTVMKASRKIVYDLRNNIYKKLMVLPDKFFKGMATGEVMNRSSSDVNMIMRGLSVSTVQIPNSILRATMSFIFMFALSWQLGLASLILLPLVLFAENYLGKKIHKHYIKVQRYFDKVSDRIQENLSGARTIKSYAQENAENDRFTDLINGYVETVKPINRIEAIWWPAIGIAIWIPILVVLYIGGFLYMNGQLTTGNLAAYVSYIVLLIWPMIALGWAFNMYYRLKVSVERIYEILSAPVSIKSPENAYKPDKVKGDIELSDVSLLYDGGEYSIKNISITIPHGQTVGIVGPVGAGKSSFTKLLLRTWDVDTGSVKIDGVDVRQWDLNELRGNIGYVPQDAFLFSSSIAENISFIKPDANKEEILSVAQKVQLKQEVEDFKEGFETVIGERGVTLSGGQRQRVAIARALLANPPIMIFDDPLSAVDTHTEDSIIDAIEPTLEDRTAIIIAHRVSIMRLCDRIIVIQNGKITEDGSHNQLMELGGYYADLVEKQKLQTEIETKARKEVD